MKAIIEKDYQVIREMICNRIKEKLQHIQNHRLITIKYDSLLIPSVRIKTPKRNFFLWKTFHTNASITPCPDRIYINCYDPILEDILIYYVIEISKEFQLEPPILQRQGYEKATHT